MTRFIVVRHCEAQGNVLRVFNGITDSNITDNGRMQLSFLSERMKDLHFDYIYSSPLKRAVKTAKACNKYHKLPIHILNDLIELNGGGFENLAFAEFPNRYPEESKQWNIDPWNFNIENGESMVDLYERISNAILMLAKRHSGKTVLVASHGCAIRNLLCWAHDWDIKELNEVDWCDNTAISIIDIDENLNKTIICENDSSHIPDDFSTLSKQYWWQKEARENLVFD